MNTNDDILDALLRYSNDIVICLTKDFTITVLNASGEKFYNWPNGEAVGKDFLRLCKSFNFTCPIHEHFFDDPCFLNVNQDSKNFLGKKFNINWVICPLTSKGNRVSGAVVIGKNIEFKKNNIAYYLNGIINSIPGCLYWKDCNGRYLGCNDLTAKLAGLSSPYEVVGKTDTELWGEQASQLIGNDKKVITEGKSLYVEEELKAADGQWIYFTGIKMPLKDENNQIIGIIGNSLDVTELKRTQAELKNAKERAEAANKAKIEFLAKLNREVIGTSIELNSTAEDYANAIRYHLESIIAAMPGNVYWTDTNFVCLGCSDNLAKSLGVKSRNDLIGKSYDELAKLSHWPQDVWQSFKKVDLEVITTGIAKENIEEPVVYDQNGHEQYFLSNRKPLIDKDGKIKGVVGISIDITSRRQMERALSEAKEKAEIAARAKTEFLENMRHDIRTPLTGIIGFANIIAEESKDPKIKEYVDNLNASSYALNDLLNEILEVIRVGSNEIPILKKKFSLKNKLSDVIRLTKAIAVQKNLQLSLAYDDQIPTFLIGDYTRIHRVVLELVTNALKFTNKGSVKLSAHLEKETERETILKLEVEDTGIGISPEQQQEVFLHFKRLTPSYEGIYKGAGLGLSIVKQFVDDLDGEIYVESLKKGGARFILILPLKKSLIQSELGMEIEPAPSNIELKQNVTHMEQFQNPEPENGVKKSHVLLVEDQAIAAKVVATLLSHLDCRVDHAVNGEAALKLFQEHSYHLIFMDIGLPDLDGYEVTKRMRLFELNKTTHIPIIALTAHVDEENRQHCIDAGMNAVLSKPLTKEKATDILNAFIAHREQASSQPLPSEDQQLSPPHQAINSAKLNELYAGKKEKINDVLRLVIESYPEDLATLEVAYTNKDLAALYFCVHKLKGGASYYSAELLVNYCSQLESAIKNKQELLISDLYNQVMIELQAAIKEAKGIIGDS